MVTLEEMAENLKGVKIKYFPPLEQKLDLRKNPGKKPVLRYVTVDYNPADDAIIGYNLEGGFFENKSDTK